jgi:hypothetical protein
MFPYCNTVYSLATLIGVIMGVKLYFSWKNSGKENMGLFFKAVASATVYFILSALPGFVVKGAVSGGIVYILTWIPFYFTFFYFSRIALNFWRLEQIEKILPKVIIFLAGLTAVLGIIYFSPMEVSTYKNLTICFERSPSWVLILNGLIITILLLINSVLFIAGGIKGGEKITKTRGLMIGIGLFILALSAFAKYVISQNYLEAKFLIFFAGPSLFIGLLLVYLGIQYKSK